VLKLLLHELVQNSSCTGCCDPINIYPINLQQFKDDKAISAAFSIHNHTLVVVHLAFSCTMSWTTNRNPVTHTRMWANA